MLLDVTLSFDTSGIGIYLSLFMLCIERSLISLLQKYSHPRYIQLCLEIVILFQYAQMIKS